MHSVMQRTGRSIRDIYQDLSPTVFRVAFGFMKNRHDSEDVVHDTFLRLMQSELRFASPEHEKAWLIVTAENICRDKLRRHHRRDADLDQCRDLAAPPVETGTVLDAVLDLPDKYKTVVYLFYYEGYSAKEIAEMLGKPQSTIRSQVFRAKTLLKKKLGGQFDEE